MRFLVPAVVLILCANLARADEIPPPFGFRWNDFASRIERVLKGAKAKTVSRETNKGLETWTVEGLIHPGLKRTLFTFKDSMLKQIELQCEYPDWTLEHYNSRMGEIRRYFDAKYGTGRLISRARDNDTDVIQTLVGYQWVVGNSALELFYFSAQKEPNVYRNITVTYKEIQPNESGGTELALIRSAAKRRPRMPLPNEQRKGFSERFPSIPRDSSTAFGRASLRTR